MQPVNRALLCLILLLSWMPLPASALSSDRNQPINIEADRATLHEKYGNSTYRGNVHLRQGTLHLHGDTMTVEMRDERIEKIVLTGNPATFVQRPDDADQDQHAEAGRIEYYAREERMILLDNARIWQLENEEFSSDRIVINLADNTVNAGGGGTGDRVRITLQPRNSSDTAPAPETAAETAPETAPESASAPAPGEATTTDNTP